MDRHMTEEAYNEAPGIRRSLLWEMRKSPAHMLYRMENQMEATPALVFGQAVHCAILTPNDFEKQFARVPDVDRRTKAGREAYEEAMFAAQGRKLLSGQDIDTVLCIDTAIRTNKTASRLLDGKHETAYFWDDELTGERCKARTDAETDIGDMHLIVDIKTCQDASTNAFMRKAIEYGYDVQAAMYTAGVKAVTGKDSLFVFIAVEKTPPYAVNILQADTDFMNYGQDRYRHLLGLYHDCRQRQQWPDYTGFDSEIGTLELPAYIRKEVE